MKVFLLALGIVAICVFGLCFNIIFRKDGQFPQFDVGSNEEMRKRGIRCMREIQDEIPLNGKAGNDGNKGKARRSGEDKICSGDYSEACKSCSPYNSAV